MLADIRLSVISDKAHVALEVSNVEAVRKAAGGAGFFGSLCQFADALLASHDDAQKVEIGFDEKNQKITVSPEASAADLDYAMKSALGQSQTIADLQAQVADAKKDADAKAKTIADLHAQVAQLTPKP